MPLLEIESRRLVSATKSVSEKSVKVTRSLYPDLPES